MQSHNLMPITPRPEVIMARGAGSYLWDEAGNRYLDFLQGWAVNCLGHSAQEVTEALTQQSATLLTPSPAYHNRPQLTLAEHLCALTGMHQAHFLNSGAEANEAAIKLARKWGRLNRDGAYQVLTTTNAFHGRTLATMAASGKPGWEEMFPPYPDGFAKVAFGDLAAMERAINDKTVAIMVEPVQGEAGVVVPPPEYLRGLRDLADQHKLLLIFDEIQTGCGRLGHLFAFQKYAVEPDVLTVGKGLGGGLPISAVLANSAAACFEYGEQGGTFNGNPLVCAVALAVLEVIADEQFLASVRSLEAHLSAALNKLCLEHQLKEVRGAGLLFALKLDGEYANEVVERARQAGLLINAARPDVLRFMPSLRVTEAEIDACIATLADVL